MLGLAVPGESRFVKTKRALRIQDEEGVVEGGIGSHPFCCPPHTLLQVLVMSVSSVRSGLLTKLQPSEILYQSGDSFYFTEH